MKIDRVQSTLRNIRWGTVNQCIRIACPFLVRTIVIKALGADYMGLSNLFTSILQVLSLAELGFDSAMVFSMYRPVAEDDTDTICALMALYKKVYRIIGAIVLTAGLIIAPFLPRLIRGSWPDDINIYVLYFIYLANIGISYFFCAEKSCVLVANQRMDLKSKAASMMLSFQYIAQMLLLLIFKNYYVYAVIIPLATLLTNYINHYYVKKIFPQYISRGILNTEMKQDIKTRVKGLVICKISDTLRNSFDNVFISMFLGLTMVTVYGNYYYIMVSVHGIITIVLSAMQASVGNSIVTESVEKNHADLQKFLYIYIWIAGVCTICLLCLYQPFMRLWVGEELMLPESAVVLICFYFYTLCQGDPAGVYSNAAGIWWKARWNSVVEAILNFTLNFVLVQFLGVHGIIVATAISMQFVNYTMGIPTLYRYCFPGVGKKVMYRNQITYVLTTATAAAVTYVICQKLGDGIAGLILRLMVCMTVPNVVFFVVYRRMKYYREAAGFVNQIIRRFKNKI